jgi:hypothetical protein
MIHMKRRQIFSAFYALAGTAVGAAKPDRSAIISKDSTPSMAAHIADIELRTAPVTVPHEQDDGRQSKQRQTRAGLVEPFTQHK